MIVMAPALAIGIAEGITYYKLQANIIHGTNLEDIPHLTELFGTLLDIYDYIRLGQVVFNTICVGAIFWVLWSINIICVREEGINGNGGERLGRDKKRKSGNRFSQAESLQSQTSSQRRNADTAYPMFLLAMRLIWYPIAQSVTRFGASWYQFAYSTTISSYPKTLLTTDAPGLLSLRLWIYVILTPTAGVFYFITFLRMQSGAMYEFKKPFLYIYDKICGKRSCHNGSRDDNDLRSQVTTVGNQSSRKNSLNRQLGHMSRSSFESDGVASNPNSYTFADDNLRSSGAHSIYETDEATTDASETENESDLRGPQQNDVESGYSASDSDSESLRGSDAARMQRNVHSQGASEVRLQGTIEFKQGSDKTGSKDQAVIGTLNASNLQKLGKNAAQERLAKMRKRTSLRSQSTAVTNIEAIVDSEEDGPVDREVIQQLDEDELFDLIALQEVRSISSSQRRDGAHQIGLGPVRNSLQSSKSRGQSFQSSNDRITVNSRSQPNSNNNSMSQLSNSFVTTTGSHGGSLPGSVSGPSTSNAVTNPLNPLRNTPVAVNENATYGTGSRSHVSATLPINISSVHSSRQAGAIDEGDELSSTPDANPGYLDRR